MTGDYRDDPHRSHSHNPRGQRGGGGRGGHFERRGIPLSELDPTTTEASRKAIGAAIEVHKTLGPGYPQSVYLAALRMELDALNVPYKVDHPLNVMYKDKTLGTITAQLFVDNRFLLEVASRPGPVTTHERLALRSQLKAANLDLGLIINFAERRLKDGLVRVVNVDKITKEKGISFDEHDEEGGPDLHDFDQH